MSIAKYSRILGALFAIVIVGFGYFLLQGTRGSTTVGVSINVNSDLDNGLIAHYTFDGPDIDFSSTTAEIIDRSLTGADFNWQFIGATSSGIGKIGQAFETGSNSNCASLNSPDAQVIFNFTDDFTIAAWVKQTSLSNAGNIFRTIAENQSGAGVLFRVDGTGTGWNINVTDGTLGVALEGDTGDLNRWYHVILHVDKSETDGARLYMNNELIDSDDPTAMGSVTAAVGRIGSRNGSCSAETWEGSIDDLRVYTRVLSEAERARLYQLGATTHIGTTIDSNDDLKDGLVGHWTFDGKDVDWGSTTAEIMNKATNTALSGNADGGVSQANVVFGKIGQGIAHDGNAGYIRVGENNLVPDALNPMANDFTAALWFKPDFLTGTPGDWDKLVSCAQPTTGGTRPGYRLRVGNQFGQWGFLVRNDSPEQKQIGSGENSAQVDKWSHLLGKREGDNIFFYVDGVLVDSATTSGSIDCQANDQTNRTDFIIGSEVASESFNGTVDDVRVYNRALSTSTIERLYQLGATTKISKTIDTNDDLKDGLIAHYTFDGKDINMSSTTAEILDRGPNGLNFDWRIIGATSSAAGKIGQAFGTGLNSNCATIPVDVAQANFDFGTGDFTITGWIKQTSLSNVGNIFRTIAENQSGAGVLFRVDGAGTGWNIRVTDGTLEVALEGDTGDLNRWYHVVLHVDKSETDGARLYMNNELIDSGDPTAIGSVTAAVGRIGARNGACSGEAWEGSIDDLRVYNRVLSEAERERLYQLGQ